MNRFTDRLILLLALVIGNVPLEAFSPPRLHRGGPSFSSSTTRLSMGVLDSLSNFLQNRQGDFVKLEETDSAFGPGPALVLYKVPGGVEDEEVYDMLADGAPKASSKGVALARIIEDNDKLLDMTIGEAMETVVASGMSSIDTPQLLSTQMKDDKTCPVIFFSGIDNAEMMATYNILGKEIYEESYGTLSPACAKAVPNAMNKPLRQVMEEISGDHMDAISMDE